MFTIREKQDLPSGTRYVLSNWQCDTFQVEFMVDDKEVQLQVSAVANLNKPEQRKLNAEEIVDQVKFVLADQRHRAQRGKKMVIVYHQANENLQQVEDAIFRLSFWYPLAEHVR